MLSYLDLLAYSVSRFHGCQVYLSVLKEFLRYSFFPLVCCHLLPWPLRLSCPALPLIKLPKCTSLLHSQPSSYSFGLQQNKLGEKAFSCLDLACIPKNFCKTNCSSTVVENFYWRVRKFYISNDRQNFKSQTKSHRKCFNFKSSCHFYCAEGVVSLCVVCYSSIKYITEPRKALYYFLPTQRSEPNKQIKRNWI